MGFAPQALISTESIPAGGPCPNGGIQVRTGIDNGDGDGIAGDGVLQLAEVDSEEFVCNGVAGDGGCAQVGGRGHGVILWLGCVLFAMTARRRWHMRYSRR